MLDANAVTSQDQLTIASWLEQQLPEVRAELDNLLSYSPEPEFVWMLATHLPQVPCAGLIDLHYDIFYFCKPVFLLAVQQLRNPDELADFLALAEAVLTDDEAVAACKEQCPQDDVDAVILWMKRRVASARRQ